MPKTAAKKTTAKKNTRKKAVKTKTFIQVLLDRSGSMGSCRANTIEGFNKFISDQKELDGDVVVSFTQFDNQFEPNYVLPLAEVPVLDFESYVPRGSTALNDSIAKTIGQVDGYIEANGDPDQVLVIIMTDGYENASSEYPGKDNPQLKSLIAEKHGSGWQFTYMGANQDAHQVAANIGGQAFAGSAFNYVSTPKGASNAFASLSSATSTYRGSGMRQVADMFAEVRDQEGKEAEDV